MMLAYEANLPKESLVNKFIPKTKFYEKAVINSRLQKEFVDKIQKITWKYKLAENTIGISKTNLVEEIQVFEIELKEQIIPKNVLKIIDKSIPYQILYCFIYKENFTFGITLKENNQVNNYYFSDWNEEINFDFNGIDLEKVYQKLVKAFIKIDEETVGNFNELISLDNTIKALEIEINMLENKIRKEKQFNRKVELNKLLLEKKEYLSKKSAGRP